MKHPYLSMSILVVVLFSLCLSLQYSDAIKARVGYVRAERLIQKQEYAKAEDILYSIRDEEYKDTESLLYLCLAHKYYEEGNTQIAYIMILCTDFRYQSAERMHEVENFAEILKSTYIRPNYPVPTPSPTATPTAAPTPAWRPSAPKKDAEEEEPEPDPFHASDYYDPEDFYEDNYDDFWDYEEAEDYWKDHH